MGASACGPIEQLERAPEAAEALSQALAPARILGLPYKPGYKCGLILASDVDVALHKTGSEPLRRFVDETLRNRREYNTRRAFGKLVVYGVVRDVALPSVMNKGPVAEAIVAAIFNQPGQLDAVRGIRQALKKQIPIFVAGFTPRGAIPDDIYDEVARILMRHGVQVYEPSGPYQILT